jgi:hypothetical protein
MISPEILPDVLNRYHDFDNSNHTVHVMKYIFPRQFGLHNVFTSTVDPRETVQPFKDYTLREQEIARHERLAQSKSAGTALSPTGCLPKRLRGQAVALVRKLQKLHSRCCYNELLKHYCPPMVTSYHSIAMRVLITPEVPPTGDEFKTSDKRSKQGCSRVRQRRY